MNIIKLPNIKFLDWFVGFSEGGGSFILPTSIRGRRFEIWQHSKNAQILYHVKSALGFGTIRFPKYRPNIAVFTVNKKEHLEIIKSVFLNRICTSNTRVRFKEFYQLDNVVLNKPSFNNAWLSGFIDTEGCFRIRIDDIHRTARLVFEISQNDICVLEKIKSLLGFKGSIRKDRNHWTLEIGGISQRIKLIEYLREFNLRSHKHIVFVKWLKGHKILEEKEHHLNNKIDGFQKLRKLANSLNKWRES